MKAGFLEPVGTARGGPKPQELPKREGADFVAEIGASPGTCSWGCAPSSSAAFRHPDRALVAG
jgi:hypothetical protein